MTKTPSVRTVRNARIKMPDGIRLASDIYLPVDATPQATFPTILEYRPYRKDDEHPPGGRFYEELVAAGYAVARVDIRGTGASEGVSTDEYLPQEQADGYAVVEWLAAQPWSDGQICMIGTSYSAFTALQVAALDPPHLRTVVPLYFSDDRYTDDCHYRGGLLRMYYDVGHYGNLMVVWNALPPAADWAQSEWSRIWEEHLTGNEPYILEWLRHQADGPYWRNGSVGDVADRIRCPVFLIGGWRDGYPNPPLRLYQKLRAPRKVLIGPWNHSTPDVAVPGPRIDYLREVIRWLDHWCKGTNTGVQDEASVVIYMQEWQEPLQGRVDTTGEWRAEAEWPPPGLGQRTLYLGQNATLTTAPPPDGADSFRYLPTVGSGSGLWSGGLPFGLPGDQQVDEALSLVYTSEPLSDDLHIVGRPRVLLHASSTATVVGVCASLADIAPNGVSAPVAKGMLNATRRKSFSEPEPVTPGEPFDLEIDIDATAWVFRRGHRLRLAIANADWPNIWPTPEHAITTIYRGGESCSCVTLPTVSANGSAPSPRFQPSPKRTLAKPDPRGDATWEITDDLLAGRRTARIGWKREHRVNSSRLVLNESTLVADVNLSDPADATAQGRHVTRLEQPNEVVEGRSAMLIRSTAKHFHVTIELEVVTNGATRFQKRWVESIERLLL